MIQHKDDKGEQVRPALLRYLYSEWNDLHRFASRPDQSPPYGVWVAEFDCVPPGQRELHITFDQMKLKMRRAWFLDRHGVRAMPTTDYLVFLAAHWVQPWTSRLLGEHSSVFGTPYHKIGLAAFARYCGSDDVYVDFVWGGTFGRGYRATPNANGGLDMLEMLWLS